MPIRIQRKREKGWRMPSNAVAVCRPGRWGNPLIGMNAGGWYRTWIQNGRQPLIDALTTCGARSIPMKIHPAYKHLRYQTGAEYLRGIEELAGWDLACWCPVGGMVICHADILLEIANQ